VEALQEAGVNAEIAKPDVPSRSQVIVEGSIRLIEGGDITARVLLGGFGPVGATRFGVAGKARRAAGSTERMGDSSDLLLSPIRPPFVR